MSTVGGNKLHGEILRLEGLLRQDPGSPEFHRLGNAYTRVGRYDDAVRVCRRGVRRHSTSVEGHVALGRALFGQGRLDQAGEVLRAALKLDPTQSEIYRLLGEVLLRLEQHEESVSALEQAVRLGVADAKVEALLLRAREERDGEATQVARGRPGEVRGIGTRTAAGSIGDPSREHALEELGPGPPEDELRTTSGFDADKTPIVEVEGHRQDGDVQPTPMPDWSTLGALWERQLDAQSGHAGLDVESDVRDPIVHRPPLDLDLLPLSDPLAEGMPPLPSEGGAEEGAAEVTEDVPAEAIEDPSPSLGLPHEPEPEEEPPTWPQGSAEPDALLEEALPVDRASPEPEFSTEEPTAPTVSEPDEEATDERQRRPVRRKASRRRRRGFGRWVALGALLLVPPAVWLGLSLYQARHASRKALELSQRARRVVSVDALRTARAALSAAATRRGAAAGLSEELRLVEALLWLLHGIPHGTWPASAEGWTAKAARAVDALATHAPTEAREALKEVPQQPANRLLRGWLLAWAAWLEGRGGEAREALKGLLAQDSELVPAHLLLAHLSREEGRTREAEEAYRLALRHSPLLDAARLGLAAALLEGPAGAAEARRLLEAEAQAPLAQGWQRLLTSELQLRSGALRAGAREARRVLGDAPPRADLLFHGARVLALACELEGARAAHRRLASLRRLDGPAERLLRVELEWAAGLDPQLLRAQEVGGEAPRVKELRRVATLLAGASEGSGPGVAAGRDPPTPLARLERAIVLLRRGDAAAADGLLAPLSSVAGLSSRALTLRAEALAARGRYGEALAGLETALDRCPGYLPAIERQGLLRIALGRFAEGARLVEAARAGGRVGEESLRALAWAYGELRSVPKASALLEEARRQGTPAAAATVLGHLRLAQQRGREAVGAFGGAGRSPEALVGLARAQLLAGQVEAAEGTWAALVERAPHSPWPRLQLARVRVRLKHAEARATTEAILSWARANARLAPGLAAEAHLALGELLQGGGGKPRPDAVAEFEAATRLDPSHVAAHEALGRAYLALGRQAAAVKALERAVELDPQDTAAHLALGLALRREDRVRARRAFARVLQLEPDGERALVARRELRRLR
ncbi:MAG: tetratricopeptide repeat protein [Deltaproteobacteria bacterium]|nr:tetratricopeptide repeat protein [Deltaproteobacteria bacterium]